MKNFLYKCYKFSGTWTGTIIIVLFLIFFVAQSFIIPSGSMMRTLLIGDFLFAKKFSYGIPIPHLPWAEIPLLPDFRGNGHLIDGPRPKREDIVIFRYPKNETIHYVKRCVAVGGDEILYADKRLMIHFHEGDDYIRTHYPASKIVRLRDKLWVVNPYKEKYPGIRYVPEGDTNVFEALLSYGAYGQPIDMTPIFVEELRTPTYRINGKVVNALYRRVPDDTYYMIGDNRDNSNDSRFWGPVPYRLIVGKPWVIYMSIEHRSYDRVMYGKGGGRDRAALQRICGSLPLASEACKRKWNKHRFTVRWKRVGRLIDHLQYEPPVE